MSELTGPIIAGILCCGMMYLFDRFAAWAVGPDPKGTPITVHWGSLRPEMRPWDVTISYHKADEPTAE